MTNNKMTELEKARIALKKAQLQVDEAFAAWGKVRQEQENAKLKVKLAQDNIHEARLREIRAEIADKKASQ